MQGCKHARDGRAMQPRQQTLRVTIVAAMFPGPGRAPLCSATRHGTATWPPPPCRACARGSWDTTTTALQPRARCCAPCCCTWSAGRSARRRCTRCAAACLHTAPPHHHHASQQILQVMQPRGACVDTIHSEVQAANCISGHPAYSFVGHIFGTASAGCTASGA